MLRDTDVRDLLWRIGVETNRAEEIVLAYRRVQRFAPAWPEPRDTADARRLEERKLDYEIAWTALLELFGQRDD